MFWQEKTLQQLSDEQWEALCDGCGRCCVWKFEDEDSKEILYTDIRCKLFDDNSCRCTNYTKRNTLVPDCMDIRQFSTQQYAWLPDTCAYRLRQAGKDLPDWHHLICGDKQAVHRTGASLQHQTVCGEHCTEEDIIHHIIDPDAVPKAVPKAAPNASPITEPNE